MNKKSILEGLKEVGRLALMAAVVAVLGWASKKVAGLDPNSAYYIVGTLALRFADKYVHVNENINASGIAPF